MLHIHTYIAGVKFRGAEARERITALAPGARLTLRPEPDNEYDPNAVKVLAGGVHVGYLPKRDSQNVAKLIADGRVTLTTKRDAGADAIEITYEEPTDASEERVLPEQSVMGGTDAAE